MSATVAGGWPFQQPNEVIERVKMSIKRTYIFHVSDLLALVRIAALFLSVFIVDSHAGRSFSYLKKLSNAHILRGCRTGESSLLQKT